MIKTNKYLKILLQWQNGAYVFFHFNFQMNRIFKNVGIFLACTELLFSTPELIFQACRTLLLTRLFSFALKVAPRINWRPPEKVRRASCVRVLQYRHRRVFLRLYKCVSLSCGTCLSRSSLTVAVSVWPVTLQPAQVRAPTRTTATGCSPTSWLCPSSLPSSSPSEGRRATWFSSGQNIISYYSVLKANYHWAHGRGFYI